LELEKKRKSNPYGIISGIVIICAGVLFLIQYYLDEQSCIHTSCHFGSFLSVGIVLLGAGIILLVPSLHFSSAPKVDSKKNQEANRRFEVPLCFGE